MRQCGDCQLCCKLLPVRAVHKPGGVRCKYQKFGVGCTVHRKLETIAPECRLWNCGWLVNEAGELGRPDHSHIVIDILPDFVTVIEHATGKQTTLPAVQVWIDPKHRDAHRDPALRAYLDRRGKEDGAVAIIRFSESDGFVLAPPSITGGNWHEDHSAQAERAHSIADVIEALGEKSRVKSV